MTGMMCSGWARSPSATTTASNGATPQPGWRSRSSTAASANATTSTRQSARDGPIAASQALATSASSDPRSAQGAGSGTGKRPLYCRARPRPASPPRATASPANSSQRATAVSQTTGLESRAVLAASTGVSLITGTTVAAPAETGHSTKELRRFLPDRVPGEQPAPHVPRADGPERDPEQHHHAERAQRHPLEERPGHAPGRLHRVGLAEQVVDGPRPEQRHG